MLKVGNQVPSFELVNQDGSTVKNTDFLGKKLVIYFYPKDMTPGCTTESCDFRDSYPQFIEANTKVIGVSKDSAISHQKFIAKHGLTFDLLVDTEGEMCDAFGVWVEKSMYGKKYMGIERTTILVDEEGVISKIWSKVKVKNHVTEVLSMVTATEEVIR